MNGKKGTEKFDLALKLLEELRKEIIASQRIRTQIIGFKIAFVSAGIGIIGANINTIPSQLLIIPSFAAIFFDLLINSYSVSIKRIGYYCRIYLEPILREFSGWSKEIPLWEEYMSQRKVKQHYSLFGELGLTFISIIVGLYGFFFFDFLYVIIIGIILFILFVFDILSYIKPRQITERGY